MSTHAAAPASAYATYRTWGLRALRNDATSAGGRGSAWGERVRDEAGRETRARVVGAARAWETRARNASRRSRDHDVDLYRPCRRSARWRARRLRSRIGRWRDDPTTRSRDAVTRHRDPAKARPTRARTAETRTVDARGVQKSRGFLRGRHPPLRACLRWTGASESGGRTSARAVATNCRLFSLGKCNRLVLHQKLQNSGSLVDKKCEIGLKINSSCTV